VAIDINDLWIDLTLRLQSLNELDWLDLLLVAIVFFLFISALERAHATFMLRGITVIAVTLLFTAFLLPLPAFSLLVTVILLSLLVTTPIVFQRELRHLLENVGRSIGLATYLQLEPEEVVQPVMRAVEQMAKDRIGALIVLEGEINLEEIAQTGVALDSTISTELLRAVFYPNNPLHDGALLIRGRQIVAAGCVLPLAQATIMDQELGTRHRAALGLVERTDAFVVVVSEETGRVSFAEEGELHRLPEPAALREYIVRFSDRGKEDTSSRLPAWLNADNQQLRRSFTRRLRRSAGRLGLALLFALMLWWFVLLNTTPLPDLEIRDVPLQLDGLAPGLVLAGDVPPAVNLMVRTAGHNAPLIDEAAFVASLPLHGLDEGVHEVAVEIKPRVEVPFRTISVDPDTVVVDLAVLARRTFPVTVVLRDQNEMPAAFEIVDEPVVEPTTIFVEGPQPLVDRIVEIQTTLSLSGIRSPLEELQPVVAVDEEGNEISQISLQPAEVTVRLDVDRRADVRDVGVAIVTEGEPAAGYWVSGLTSQPSTLILQGAPAALAAVRASVATLPVDISGAAGDISVDVPLDLTPETTAQTTDGTSVAAVRVTVRISAIRSFVTLTRPVEFFGAITGPDVAITPAEVDVLLEGPVVTLAEIERNPELLRVVVQGISVPRGSSIEQAVQVIVPEGIRAQPLPARVTISRR
jgi:diadenylate cyclase